MNPIYCNLNDKSNDTDLVMQTNELFIEALMNEAYDNAGGTNNVYLSVDGLC